LVLRKVSPEADQLLFHFNQENNLPLSKGNIVVYDLQKWEKVPLVSEEDGKDLLHDPWPILKADWIDNDSISIKVPDVVQPTDESLTAWVKSQQPAITHTINL